ncbi:MAG TPA: histidine kinase dimerization/phosphoacceptor domain -containing protein [Bryobacteraceae bacterium]|nr:histidine kinase dimerization/phosphoacceptor domain -containing protein [Bryobacteraceae bacterium]
MNTSIRVLILEDRSEDAELMARELRRCHFNPECRRVDTESEYNAHLGWQPDIILADYNMPLLDAPRALKLLHELNMDIPFIVVSGAIGEDTAVEMMRQGAADYLLKDRLARLGPAVTRALEEARLRDETRRAAGALRASEVRFFTFMNHSPAMAFIKDQEGRYLYVNNTCERMWGTTLAECLGKTNHDLWPAEVAAQLQANDAAVNESGVSSQFLEEIRLRGGRTLYALTFRFPFDEADGRRLLGGVSIDISEQVKTQRELSSALATKELLLKELHHRVKNNLQVISSLLAMQAESVEDASAIRALQESQERVQCMALIHERLNRDSVPDRLDFREYLETLSRDLFYSYGVDTERIKLRFEVEPLSLGLDQAIPCGLILNELLTNSLKYAFPNGRRGEIVVKLSSGDDELVMLTVADDGVGPPPGFNWQESPSLGLRIMSILGRQLDGKIESQPGPGVRFTLTFPGAFVPAEPSAIRPGGANRFGHTA